MPDWLQALDGAILLWLQETVRGPLLTVFFTWYTALGNAGLIWIVLSLGLLCFRRTRRAGAASLLALMIGALCTNVILKQLVQRPRPWLMVEGLVHIVETGDPNSFPSGHTTAAFAAGVAWFCTLSRRGWRLAALAAAFLMGFSRLYVGVHYPSDVLDGALIGTMSALAALALLRVWEKKRKLE